MGANRGENTKFRLNYRTTASIWNKAKKIQKVLNLRSREVTIDTIIIDKYEALKDEKKIK